MRAVRPAPAGRFAPSPSGRMHVGNVFSALLAWLSARHDGLAFRLRLEDLDPRCKDEQAASLIEDDLRWLGLDWDGEAQRQSAHPKRYKRAYARLRQRAHVYPCFCSRADLHAASAPHASDGTPVYSGACRDLSAVEIAAKTAEMERRCGHGPAYRVELPDCEISLADGHAGPFVQDIARECGDVVVVRGDGVFAYQLACVVDDAAQGVVQIVRGDDLLSSTPRQICLQRLLGLPEPAYFHHPLLIDAQGRRLSKRDRDLDMGFLRAHLEGGAAALVGWLAFWAGLRDTPAPAMPAELVGGFSWETVVSEPVTACASDLPLSS